MDFDKQLEKARSLSDEGNPGASLKLLDSLYDPSNPDLDVMLEMVNAFEDLGQLGRARAMLGKAIKHFPPDSELWLHLSSLYRAEEDYARALEAINIALQNCGDEPSLLFEKSHLLAQLGRREEMHALIDAMISRHPQQRSDLLVERASIYELLSYEPAKDEAQVKNVYGVTFAVNPLRYAIQDLDQALDAGDLDWRIMMKRAKLNKDLQEFEEAIIDYDNILLLLDDDDTAAREFIEQERDDCLNGGLNERNRMAGMLLEGMADIDERGELSQDEMMTNNLLGAMAGNLAQGGDIMQLVEEIDDDPEQMTALSIAQDILNNAREPSADFVTVNPKDFADSAQEFCDRAEKTMASNGLKKLGDFEAQGLSQQIGSRILLRIFLSEDQRICAAAYEVKPLKPNFLLWLLMLVLGKWKKRQIVELESETSRGRFIITNNSGDSNPFAAGDDVDMVTLPHNSSIEQIISSHLERLCRNAPRDILRFESLAEVFALQDRLRLAKNAYRERIGFVTDAELQQLLGRHYDQYADDVRKYLFKLTGAVMPERT